VGWLAEWAQRGEEGKLLRVWRVVLVFLEMEAGLLRRKRKAGKTLDLVLAGNYKRLYARIFSRYQGNFSENEGNEPELGCIRVIELSISRFER
jgi:hypothetical protein